MKKEMICIICPRGCQLEAEINENGVTVSGNSCPRGMQYGIDECTHPMRTVTSVIRVSNRDDCMVSVKTDRPIPKEKIFELMSEIRGISAEAPINIGDIILKDRYGANVVATKHIS